MSSNHSDGSNYGYTPSEAWCITFIVLFSLTAMVHTAQAVRSKYWVVFPTLVTGALTEILGWSGRLWSNRNIDLVTPFLMQISTQVVPSIHCRKLIRIRLIIAPVFFSAWDYTLLGIAISKLGPQYSVVGPRYYLFIFLTADIISLVLQAVGGGQASAAATSGVPTTSATNIMVSGIIFQLISMVVFVSLGFDFIRRVTRDQPYASRQRQRILSAEKKARKTGTSNVEKSVRSVPIGEDVQPKENLNRWWILLAGAVVSSLMIICRGKPPLRLR